jgi:hypothetical protein
MVVGNARSLPMLSHFHLLGTFDLAGKACKRITL